MTHPLRYPGPYQKEAIEKIQYFREQANDVDIVMLRRTKACIYMFHRLLKSICVYRDRIMQCLDHAHMDCNDKWVIKKQYWRQTATVRFSYEYSEFFPIDKGMRQGYVFITKTFQLVCRRDLQ